MKEMLKLQMEKMQKNKKETWRLKLPKDLEHPLAIKRPSSSMRRVTFPEIYQHGTMAGMTGGSIDEPNLKGILSLSLSLS